MVGSVGSMSSFLRFSGFNNPRYKPVVLLFRSRKELSQEDKKCLFEDRFISFEGEIRRLMDI